MSAEDQFTGLIRRVRTGDGEAAAELVSRYEPLIRREVRLRLVDQRLGRLFDPADVCQSVLVSFFLRTAAGQYDLANPDQLVKLLLRMARNKLASAARAQSRDRRDHRRVTGGEERLRSIPDKEPTPSRILAGRELLDRFRGLLDDEELRIADLRTEGLAWAEVATQLGGTAQGRRMQLARAVERAAEALGLDTHPEEVDS